MANTFENLKTFEFALLILLAFVGIYFIFLTYRDIRLVKNLHLLTDKVRGMIEGQQSLDIKLKGEPEIVDLGETLNELDRVYQKTHDNLAQEKNRLSNILTYMTDGVLATNSVGRITMINEKAQKQFNLSEQEALGKSIIAILGDDADYSFRELVEKTPELTLYRRDEMGEFITLHIRFAKNRHDSGFVTGLVAVSHDATEQEKEERERRLFVSNVSHELRTPLTSIKSYLEALDEGILKEEVAPSFVKVSLDETNRMMRMISDLLALSRIDNQVTKLEIEMTNFTAFITSILNRFEQITAQQSASKKIDILRDYPLSPIWIEIDTDKMTQVLDNVLNNAIKYSPDGGKVTISMQTTDSQLILSISDEGLGIPKKDLPLVFDRFYRVDKARSRSQGGTGLGLSIAKEIVKLHKGFIWAKSDYGNGSTFTIVLPYNKESAIYDEWEEEEE
ncbi:cell wall metabolism sensor histidine kinase VicK [Streptococcus sciuri]|uniref:histidine kinase n=1 Tax=Streptococcus sciuri TaxID=2973939 RepID=A0ABT2F7G5_9STRE|nr:cell wall metabolism sensor histidine kinase VicK [Streptococcus sciuri]MCS4488347.1 cell wall metabolism sensor histidine kinase VicK [Streptococcus sciuri]